MNWWLCKVLRSPEGGEGGEEGGGAEGGGVETGVATKPLLEQNFPSDESVPERFRGKPVSEAISAYQGYLSKINNQVAEIKQLKEAAEAAKQVVPKGADKSPAEIADQLQEVWQNAFTNFQKNGTMPDEAMTSIREHTHGMFTDEDISDFARWRQDRNNEYLTICQKMLEDMEGVPEGVTAADLVALYNDQGGDLFTDEDEVMLNRLVRLRNPEAVKIILNRFQEAKRLASAAGAAGARAGGQTPMNQLRQGEIQVDEKAGFADRDAYEKALSEARMHYEATGDDSKEKAVQAMLEKSGWVGKT